MKKLRVMVLGVLFGAVMIFGSCSLFQSDADRILGNWWMSQNGSTTYSSSSLSPEHINFTKDTMTISDDSSITSSGTNETYVFGYTLDESAKTLSYTYLGVSASMDYKIDGSTLTLSVSGLSMVYTKE